MRFERVCFAALGAALGCASAGSGVNDAGAGGDAAPAIDAAPYFPDAEPGVEVCDGIDNDGDQFVDEGTPEEVCGGPVANGVPRCNGLGGCRIDACNEGWFDVDNLYNTGCECAQEPDEAAGGDECATAKDLGAFPDTNQAFDVLGNLVPADDVDWYRFDAVDTPDTTCDLFHARAQLLGDANDEFRIEVWRGGCEDGQKITETPCTDMRWYTNFNQAGSPPTGECPCTGPGANQTNVNRCNDNSATFYVKVSRVGGKPLSCNGYKVEISNGKYPAP
jgi:hypothetical protein